MNAPEPSTGIVRHHLGWNDLTGRRVGIWGLGVEGTANLAKAVTLDLDVVAVDHQMAGEVVEGVTVDGDAEALLACDVVVKSPGISRYGDRVRQLEAAGVAVVGGHGLWMVDREMSGTAGRVAAVTGTKGKSTTVAVIGHLFDRLGLDGAIGGNIGSPPYDPRSGRTPTYWCLELSSYQVTDFPVRPGVVALTSLSADHVEWHGTLDRYYRDKLSLATLPPAAGLGEAVVLAATPGGELSDHADLLGPDVRWITADGGGVDHDDDSAFTAADGRGDTVAAVTAALGLLGRHNEANVAMALAVVESLTGRAFALDELVAAAEGFVHLSSRLTPVATVDDVLFVDDCLSTNTLPTVAALDVFADRPTVLIAGGFDRGIDYGPLGRRLARSNNPTLVLALDAPDNGPTVLAAVEAASAAVETALIQSVSEGVDRGFAWCRAHGGGVVLLSPAAPTRGQALGPDGRPIPTRYPNYGAKAAAFVEAVEALSANR